MEAVNTIHIDGGSNVVERHNELSRGGTVSTLNGDGQAVDTTSRNIQLDVAGQIVLTVEVDGIPLGYAHSEMCAWLGEHRGILRRLLIVEVHPITALQSDSVVRCIDIRDLQVEGVRLRQVVDVIRNLHFDAVHTRIKRLIELPRLLGGTSLSDLHCSAARINTAVSITEGEAAGSEGIPAVHALGSVFYLLRLSIHNLRSRVISLHLERRNLGERSHIHSAHSCALCLVSLILASCQAVHRGAVLINRLNRLIALNAVVTTDHLIDVGGQSALCSALRIRLHGEAGLLTRLDKESAMLRILVRITGLHSDLVEEAGELLSFHGGILPRPSLLSSHGRITL